MNKQKTYKTRYNNGNVEYHNINGQLHRTDGPAVIKSDGYKVWDKDGVQYREDGPDTLYKV